MNRAEMAVAATGVASPQGGCWGQLDPDGILQLEGEANFKRTQRLLCMGLFSKN